MIKLRSLRFSRSNSKHGRGQSKIEKQGEESLGQIRWEMRPGGMLVQQRECKAEGCHQGLIVIKVSTVSQFHQVSIGATSTFGELKTVLSLLTGLQPSEQRLLFKGKEREDEQHLHMVGVGDQDKVFLLEDPALKERKLQAFTNSRAHLLTTPCRTIRV